MGIFNKKEKAGSVEDQKRNELLSLSLEINKSDGTLNTLPEDTPEEVKEVIKNIKFYVFEYVKQLNEAKVFSKKAVYKFIQEDYPWVTKNNMDKLIGVAMYNNYISN